MARLEELLIGREIAGRYWVEAVLGRGGMGVVYRSTDERLRRTVALKVLSPPVGSDTDPESLRIRFRREARAAASIHHPCVVTVHDYGTDPELDLDYLVMELLAGEDLARRLSRRERPTLERTLAILYESAAGLAAGHRLGIVHRDVKPANIFLVEDAHATTGVRLLDFGIAQDWSREGTLTRLTEFGRMPLTPLYASPEQTAGHGELTPASDVYSLGMTALAMLSPGEPRNLLLVGERSPIRLGHPGAGGPAAGLEEILLRALQPDPRLRFPDGGSFAEALDRLRGGATAQRIPPLPSSPNPAPAGPHPSPAPPVPRAAAPAPARRRPRARFGVPVVMISSLTAVAAIGAAVVLQLNRSGSGADREDAGAAPAPAPVESAAAVPASPPPPARQWPSLSADEEQVVQSRRNEGMSETEALLRLAVDTGTRCEFGSDADACERRREIEAYLEQRGLVRMPDAAEQERLASEGGALVRDIQDARAGMRIVHPRLFVNSGGAIERHPARVFVRDGNVRKAVADFRLENMPGGPVRVVEEYYFDPGGQLVYVRRRTWGEGDDPVGDESYHFRSGTLVQASEHGQPPARSPAALHLDALLVHARGEAIRSGVAQGRSDIPISIEDLYPDAE